MERRTAILEAERRRGLVLVEPESDLSPDLGQVPNQVSEERLSKLSQQLKVPVGTLGWLSCQDLGEFSRALTDLAGTVRDGYVTRLVTPDSTIEAIRQAQGALAALDTLEGFIEQVKKALTRVEGD